MKYILVLLLLIQTLPAAPLSSSKKTSNSPDTVQSFDLKRLMTTQEQRTAGVDKLTNEQLTELENWLSKYDDKKEQMANQVSDHEVSAVLSEGQYVRLGNGEVWVISPNCWLYTYYWSKGDPVTVSKSKDMLYPIQLTNGHSGQSVNAALPSKGTSKSFGQGLQISKIENKGQVVTLSDGSCWQVQMSARYMVQGWSVGSTVFLVKRENTTGDPYELYNGETSRTIYVTPLKKGEKPSLLLRNSTQSSTFPTSQNRSNGS